MDFVTDRQKTYPDLHVFHYAPYEPTALKRLMGLYATREDALDRLLRGGIFIDLYGIVRQSIRASVERYSIKSLEPLYGFARQIPLRDASSHLRAAELVLELGGSELDAATRLPPSRATTGTTASLPASCAIGWRASGRNCSLRGTTCLGPFQHPQSRARR